MRAGRRFLPDRQSPRLVRARSGDRTELFTEAVGTPPPVYGERWIDSGGHSFRSFEPGRSKLSAAIVHDWKGPIPTERETWLYLGAASGTTASHIADLVGAEGRVFALERSLRPFARLLALAERWPNVLPILGDARSPREIGRFFPPVDGIYADVAQPDQVEILRRCAELALDGAGGAVLLALKTSSMGRELDAPGHLAVAERELRSVVDLAPSVRLDPFHKGHYFVGGTAGPALFGPGAVRPATASPGPRPVRRRP
ncbi:MAG: fibrillarin-like rRNA/tRNA 2'-O-methyltransferase [Thermoplasmata archaeon]